MPMSGCVRPRPSCEKHGPGEHANSERRALRCASISAMTAEDRVGQPVPADRRWLRALAIAFGILGVVLCALVTHLFFFVGSSLACSGFYDYPPAPAAGSPQGWLCGQDPSLAADVIWDGAFFVSLVATVALIVLAWRRGSWRLGLPSLALLVVLPMVTAWLLNLPSDDCTPKAVSHNPGQCIRGS
jgi:hypothetical protein